MAALVTWAASLPIRATRKGAGVVLFLVGIRRRRRYAISVAGLDESKAQPLYFALRRAATHHDEQDTADRWLEALHLCQCASILLMSELDVVEGNLLFWHRQEQRGRHSHFWQSMLQRGPLQFMGRLAVILHISRRQHGALGEADLVEKRVLIFRLLRSALCEALAQVQSAAGLLYLKGHVAASAGALPPDEENLFHRADRMVTASLSAVASAFAQLELSVHNTLDGQQGPAAPPAQDWQVLQGALSRVLGMHHLRNVLSRLQLAQEQQPALEGGPELAATTDAEAADAAGEITAVEAVAADAAPNGAASSALTAVAALDRARRAVGVTAALPANVTVHSMLEHAHRTARSMGRARRLIEVPRWALMPSDLQRHWVRYAAITLAAGYSSLFIYRHSQLSGSRDLEVWAASLVSSVRGAWRSHVVGPLAGVKDELFNTFRRRPTVISTDDFEAERGSLQRMLVEFQHDFARKRGSSNASSAAADTADSYGLAANGGTAAAAAAAHQAAELQRLQEGMDLVMRTYERELKKPLRNLVGGELVRALLIQVQKLKVDTASAMVEMDQILKANELSIQLVAAVPAFLIAGGSLYWLGRLVTPTPPDPRREALPVRMSMIEVERALEHVAAAEEAAEAAGPDAVEGDAEAREQQGQFAYRLAVAYEEAQELFRRHRGLIAIGGSEWPNIRSDMLSLASPGPVAQHMRTVQRMMRSYSIFQQF